MDKHVDFGYDRYYAGLYREIPSTTSTIKFTTLTNRFSRSEGVDNEATRRVSAVAYSPVLTPLQFKDLDQSFFQLIQPSLKHANSLSTKVKHQKIQCDELLSAKESLQVKTQSSPLESTPTSQTPDPPATAARRILPREVTNQDLYLALRTYLDYFPLVGEDEEEEESQSPSSCNTMESNKGHFEPKAQTTVTSHSSVEGSPPRLAQRAESDLGTFTKGEEVLIGLGREKIHSMSGRRARCLPKQAAAGKELSSAAETEEETSQISSTPPTPPIPPRNPARLLRGNATEETVLAVSYRWQRRQIKRQALAAGLNTRIRTGVASPMVADQGSTEASSSQTPGKVHNKSNQDQIQITNKVNTGNNGKNEVHEATDDHDVGLGISIEQRTSLHDSGNFEKDKFYIGESHGAQGSADNVERGRNHAEEESSTPPIDAKKGDIEPGGPKPDIAKQHDIGLGINVYGLCQPFGHCDEDDEQKEEEDGDLKALVEVLLAAWKVGHPNVAPESLLVGQRVRAADIAGVTETVDSTETVGDTQLEGATGAIHTAVVVDGTEAEDTREVAGSSHALRHVETTHAKAATEKTVVTEEHFTTDHAVPEDIGSAATAAEEANVVEPANVEATYWEPGRARNIAPTPPLSVAIGVAVPGNVGASPTSTTARVEQQASVDPTEPVKNVDVIDQIDQLLEINYRGQAESFSRKVSGASAVRSLSTRSGTAGTSHRATSQPSAAFSCYTPSRFAEGLVRRAHSLRTPSAPDQVVIRPFAVCHGGETRERSGGNQDPPSSSPHVTYGHRFCTIPNDSQQLSVSKTRPWPVGLPESSYRGPFYFTAVEREHIEQLVHAEPRGCQKHPDCTECYNTEYAYFENKIMPTTIPPEERNRIISNNRSLRTIKNELEALAETGAISDDQFDTIMNALPAESPLSGTSRTAPVTSPVPPTAALSNLNMSNNTSPPAYTSAVPPSLPDRNSPSRPELTRATALYRYAEPGDCNFEVGDEIAVHEYMNADWWLGKNLRTGQEGVFPVNYVQPQANPTPPGRPGPSAPPQNPYLGNEKGNDYGGGYPPQQQPYQSGPPAGPSDPYNSAVPPMQVAAQPVENRHGKGAEMGKKFGKKLGNAAIFGAGATIGSDLVNSIF